MAPVRRDGSDHIEHPRAGSDPSRQPPGAAQQVFEAAATD